MSLEDDAYLASLVRVTNRRTLRPKTFTLVWGKFKGQKQLNKRKVYSVSAINTGFTSLEPGLMVTNSVARVGKRKGFSFLVCNNTNRTITLRRGNVVARAEEVSGEMTPVTGIEGCTLTDDEGSADCKANIPDEFRDAIVKLLEENKGLFVKNDLDLGRTNTVTCKIDTGTHPPYHIEIL